LTLRRAAEASSPCVATAQQRLWPGSRTKAGKAASPAGASNAREVALFRVAGITPVRQGTYIL